MIISRTPYRISFFGGGTDYPKWYQTHGGSVLATTINKYSYISCRYLPPFFGHKYRVVYSKIEVCQSIEEIEHPAVRGTLGYLDVNSGLSIHHDGDLPARSGIGSSSSFTVGLLHALYALKGQMPTKQKLAEESIYIEQEIIKETVGCQDQVLAAYGGFNHITFPIGGGFAVRPLTISRDRVEELESHLMLFYTGIERTASDIAQSYVSKIQEKAKELEALNKLVESGIEILNGGQDIGEFGELLDEAWQLKRGLGGQVSTSTVDRIYREAILAGAIGGKLIGAGGGGFMLLFARPADQPRVREKLNELLYVPFEFESSGSQIIFFDGEQNYSNRGSAGPIQPGYVLNDSDDG